MALGLSACSTDDVDLFLIEEGGMAIPAGDVRITFRTNLPTAATTRAGMLEGEADPAVTKLQMLCFDRYGTYVGRRTATTLTSNHTTPDRGTFEGTVPDVTAHIHFIGNLELTFPASSIGKHENVLMHSLETTTFYESAPNMVYWGYVRKDTPEEMQAWLNPQPNTPSSAWNVVYMIHDRAQVKLATKTEGGSTVVDFDDNTIESIDKWIISNGREHGYVAPFNQSASTASGPFVGYYTETSSGGTTTRVASPVFTECTEGGRYTATEDKLADATAPLFLYDDINQLGEGATNTVKVILKVTYKTGGAITNANKVRYQVVLLQDKNKQQLHITRNHTYIIHLNRLPWELGYASLADAAAATSFTNGQMVSVAEAVSDITNGEISMKLNNGKTSVIYQEASDAGRTVLIPFSLAKINGGGAPFTLDDDGNATETKVSASDFTVVCDHNTGALSTNTADLKINDYDPDTGIGHISMKTGSISTNLQEAKVTITDKNYGMSRVLNVYTISQFTLSASLERVEGKQRTGISGNNTCPTYKLSLTLPGNYPVGLYPITVKFATSTLNAFSDTSADQAHGSFGVAVESTADLTNSTTTNAWNYKAKDWGYWYTYEIPARPEGVDDQHLLKLDIYLDDVRGLRETRASQVGLFLKIQYFGETQTLTAT